MPDMLSESQREVIRLGDFVGEEVNTISFSLLFPSTCEKSILSATAASVARHRLLNQKYEASKGCLVDAEDSKVVKPVSCFESKEKFDKWARKLASSAVNKEQSTCEIVPVCIAESTAGFFVRAHHLVLDGWSAAVLADELLEAYRCMCEGTPVPQREDYPYSGFVTAEAEHFKSKRAAREADFWKDTMAGKTDGTIYSDQVLGDYSTERYCVALPISPLYQLSVQTNRTLQSVIITVLAAALFRMEDRNSFNLGALLFNRITESEQLMIGNCFTTAPMPIEIAESATFLSLNDEISDSLFALLKRQRTSYSRIVNQAFGDGFTQPLFDVLFNYMDVSRVNLGNAAYQWYASSRQLESLQVGIVVGKEELTLNLDYRKDRLSSEKVCELANRMTAIIENIAADGPAVEITKLEQAPNKHRQQIMAWNRTEHDYPDQETLISCFLKQAAEHPDKTALIYENDILTYRQFLQRVKRLAALLRENGIEPGRIVGIMADRSFDMMTAIYAVVMCGAAYMPIAVDLPQDRVGFMLQDSASHVLLTQTYIHVTCPDSVKRIDVDAICWTECSAEAEDLSAPSLPAYVIYTSGSTGTPKGVLIAHHSAVDRIHWMNRMFEMRSDDVVLQKTPYTFDVSVWELFWWSNYGGTLAILPPEAHKDPQKIIDSVAVHKVTKMHFVPSMLVAFLGYAQSRNCSKALSSLRQVFVSGEALMPAHVRRFYELGTDAKLINLYGPTECTVDVSWFICEPDERKSIPIGRPVDNTQLYVLDKHLKQVPNGAPGELCVAGNLVGIGYLNRPELTAERFVDSPFGSGKLYHTGDAVYWNAAGEIEYIGRMDFQVKLRGQRIELGEIESRLAEFPGVDEAVALVQQSASGEQQLVAYYTGKEAIPAQKLKEHLGQSLACYMIPMGFMFLPALPMTASGKVDRKRLPQIEIEAVSEDYDAPQSPLEEEICRLFAKELDIDQASVGRDYNFFQHGGTSLSAIMLLVDLPDAYHVQVSDLYHNPTPAQLAAHIASAERLNDDYSAELPFFKVPMHKIANPGLPAGKSILLTGATGFLGIHLLKELLLKYPQTEIICLIRDEKKLHDQWEYMFDEPFPEDRILVVIGDIGSDRLGMADADYHYCAEHVAAVYNSAADVRHFGNWEASYRANTLGVKKLIAFCGMSGAALHHVSTMSVNGFVLTSIAEKMTDEFTEENLFVGQRFRENIYVHSKYLAEKEILSARKDGLKANIYRVGNLIWRRSDGRFQRNRETHDFYMLSHALLELQAIPDIWKDLPVDLTPVDDVAKAIVLLSSGDLGSTYHLMNPYPVTVQSLGVMLSDKSLPAMGLSELQEAIKPLAGDRKFSFLAAYLAANSKNDEGTYAEESCSFTVDKLRELGFVWVKPTREYAQYIL